MSRWMTRAGGGLIAGACVAAALFWYSDRGDAQQRKDVAVESLLPKDAVLYFGWDGGGAHEEAWKQTAAYAALYETGLVEAVAKTVTAVVQRTANDPRSAAAAKVLGDLWRTVNEEGVSFALGVTSANGPPLPQAVLVLHGGAELEPGLSRLIQEAAQGEMTFQTKKVEGRSVTSGLIPETPDYELGWWVEGGHLVVAAGKQAIDATIATAAGESEDITRNPLWKRYRAGQADFTVASVGWLDFAALRETFGGMPLPAAPGGRRLTVNDVLEPLGLDGLQTIASQSGYKGPALWSETVVETKGERRGLLAFGDAKPISLKDLPPLPHGASGFYAASINPSAGWKNLLTIIRDVSKLGPPEAQGQVEGIIDTIPQIAQFDPQEEFFDTLGDVLCIYAEPNGGLFGMGIGVAVKVKDADTLSGTLERILSMVTTQTNPDELTVRETRKHGREIVQLAIGGGFFNPSYVVDKDWWVIGLTPQSVEAFLLRLDGTLPRWEPGEELSAALEELPREFVSISTTDPRASVQTLMTLAPLAIPALQQGLREGGLRVNLPVSAADLPPAELVARPLFPNVTVATADENGFRWTSRQSLPSFPLGGGGVTSVPTAAVLVALLLPAVQSAREAARRTQSRNNMHNMVIALHNYAETHGQLPAGKHPNEGLKPDKRLSWMADLLPFIEQPALYRQIDFKAAWDADANADALSTPVPIFVNPGVGEAVHAEYGVTHYVGIAGVGKESLTAKRHNAKTGVFGFDRVTRLSDVVDGLSNTIGFTEASGDFGPWGAGGNSTVRAFTKQPYINGPDGIGGPYQGGMHIGVMDGVVRFVSEDVDPSVLEALSTVNGNDIVGEY